MVNIRVDMDYTIQDGSGVVFTAPCNCNEVVGLKVYFPGGSKEFLFKDAHGVELTGISNLFSAGAYVKAILDVTNGYAYIQNANTNAYLEARFDEKAPAGWGYGGVMTYLNVTDGTFEDKLNNILADMPDFSAKQIQFYDTVGLASKKFCGTLWRYTAQYATLEGVNYDGNKALKCMYGGKWNPWEWINPPMADGVEYRTTKRDNGKPVYVTSVNFGALPANSHIDVQISTAGSVLNMLSINVMATDKDGKEYPFPFITSDGLLRGAARMGGSRTVLVFTYSNISDYTGKLIAEYTKQ